MPGFRKHKFPFRLVQEPRNRAPDPSVLISIVYLKNRSKISVNPHSKFYRVFSHLLTPATPCNYNCDRALQSRTRISHTQSSAQTRNSAPPPRPIPTPRSPRTPRSSRSSRPERTSAPAPRASYPKLKFTRLAPTQPSKTRRVTPKTLPCSSSPRKTTKEPPCRARRRPPWQSKS